MAQRDHAGRGYMEMNVVIAGEAGQGAFSVELELTEILSTAQLPFFRHQELHVPDPGRPQFSYDPHRRSSRPCPERRKMGHGDRPGRGDGAAAQAEPPRRRDLPLPGDDQRDRGGGQGCRSETVAASNSILVGIVLAVIGVSPEKLAEAAESGKAEYLKEGFRVCREMETDRGRSRVGAGR